MLSGNLRKMVTELSEPVQYHLPVGDQLVDLNARLGKPLSLHYQGAINCIHCGRKSKKSFSQGYCYPCFRSLAQCDMCIVKPENCHFHLGTCREPEWGESHCMQPHYVYLANTTAVKVGITRASQIPTRWMDQGATQALQIAKVSTRLQSGLLEVVLKKHLADKTNWRKMLQGNGESLNLSALREQYLQQAATDIEQLQQSQSGIELLYDTEVQQISYPVLEFPSKISSFNFDKTPEVSGVLMGVKGQYLIFDTGVINIRKFAGYLVEVE